MSPGSRENSMPALILDELQSDPLGDKRSLKEWLAIRAATLWIVLLLLIPYSAPHRTVYHTVWMAMCMCRFSRKTGTRNICVIHTITTRIYAKMRN
jgi:hypothetical protein